MKYYEDIFAFNKNETRESPMEHKIYVGYDSTDSGIYENESVDLTVTSPPYNLGMNYGERGAAADSLPYSEYLDFTMQWLENVWWWSKPHGRLCINVPIDIRQNGRNEVISTDIIEIAKEVGWNYFTQIIWNKRTVAGRTAWGSWKSATAPHIVSPLETIIVLYKGLEWKRPAPKGVKSDLTGDEFKSWVFGRWDFNGISGRDYGNHPAPYPLILPTRCIKLFSFPGDTVLDPFIGTGTTAVACVNLNRCSFANTPHKTLVPPPHESGVYFARMKSACVRAGQGYAVIHA